MSRQAGSIVRGEFKAAPDIRLSGPAAGGGYVLREQPKVKVSWNPRLQKPREAGVTGSVKIKGLAGEGLAGRSGRARASAPRFWVRLEV